MGRVRFTKAWNQKAEGLMVGRNMHADPDYRNGYEHGRKGKLDSRAAYPSGSPRQKNYASGFAAGSYRKSNLDLQAREKARLHGAQA